MKVLIEAPFSLTDEDKLEIEEKVSGLEKFSDQITAADVFFKLNDSDKFKNVTAKVQLRVPGPELFAEASKKNHMEALTDAVRQVRTQLLKRKNIQQDHHN
jgi:ribosomal subunit interface protein